MSEALCAHCAQQRHPIVSVWLRINTAHGLHEVAMPWCWIRRAQNKGRWPNDGRYA